MAGIFSYDPMQPWQRQGVNGEEIGQVLAGVIGGSVKAATDPAKTTNFLQKFGTGFQEAQDSNYDLKQKAALLQIQSKNVELDVQHMQLDDQQRGMREYPEWLRATGGDPQKMLTTPFTGTSQSAAAMVEKSQQAAWQRTIQQDAIAARMQDAQNKVEVAKIKAQSDAVRIQAMKDIATMKVNAAKAGKTYEFEQLQSDWESAQSQLATTTDLDVASTLRQRIQQDEDRMKKLSMFASQVPTTSSTTTTKLTDPTDPNKVVSSTVKKSGPSSAAPASKAKATDSDPLGLGIK